ncbi:hypothetical protein ACQJBY_063100 [Aegilops geniculata]
MGEFRKEFKHKNPKNKSVAAVGKAAGGRWKSLSESIIVYQLARTLLFCHGRGVRHHDLEPHNLQIGGWVGILWFSQFLRQIRSRNCIGCIRRRGISGLMCPSGSNPMMSSIPPIPCPWLLPPNPT